MNERRDHHRDEERDGGESAEQTEDEKRRTTDLGEQDELQAHLGTDVQWIGEVVNQCLVLERLGNPMAEHQEGNRDSQKEEAVVRDRSPHAAEPSTVNSKRLWGSSRQSLH